MLFGDSPGIDRSVITLKLFNLSCPCARVDANLFKESSEFCYSMRGMLM